MEGTSIALPAVGTIVARAATSGQRAPIQLPTLAAWTSTVSPSGRSSTTIRRAASRFVASPKDLGSIARKKQRQRKQKPTTASTTFFTSSPSRYRMEGSSIALPAVGTLVARTASSGQRAPIQAPTLGTCTSSVSTSGRSTAAIRRSASQFVTSPKDLGSKVKENKNRRPHQQPPSQVPLLATVWRVRRSHYRRLGRS